MNIPLPPILETKLADFRQRVWTVKLTEGILAALFGLAVSFLLIFALDRVWETPAAVRWTVFLATAATVAIGLPLKWYRWVWCQRRLEDAARLLRVTFPRLGDQLLGIVELTREGHAAAGRSERLVQAAMAQAAVAVEAHDFKHAVPRAKHLQWFIAAAGAVMIAGMMFEMCGDAANNAAARWLMPWKNIERYTFGRVRPLPSPLVIPYAEPFQFNVQLASDTLWKPESSRARLEGQTPVSAPLAGGAYPLAFPPQKQDTSLSLTVGDVRKTVPVQPRPRPELEEMALRLRLPSYLGYKSEPRLEARSGSVSVLKGAEASFEAKASRALASATLDQKAQPIEGDKIVSAFLPVTADAEHQFAWIDQLGLTPREPLTLKVRAVGDEAPKVLARRESNEEVVLDSEVLNFDLNASDDFGVKRVGLEWHGVPQPGAKDPISGQKIAAAGEPEKRDMTVRATFCATREGVAPQTLEIRAWVEDYLPGRAQSHSATFLVHVLSKADHALWLTEQFGKWLSAAKESYEREQQLHQTNKELRALEAADLDRPENRRRVSQQAAAENANAARVDSLTQAGRQLVEQGTRNDEFDAKRLESWATMLQALKDIAANRMPSVADLLKQSASAAAKTASAQNAKSGEPSPSSPKTGEAKPGENDAKSSDSKSAPNVSHGPQIAGATKPVPPTEGAPKPPAPSIQDREASLSKPEEAPNNATANNTPKAPSAGKLKLPTTTLGAAPKKDKDEEKAAPPETPAQDKLENAITEQKDLLAEFAKVSDQLSEILASLEASTFVKRLKTASRAQMKMASTVNQKTLDAFGIANKAPELAPALASDAKKESEFVHLIQSDLDAYFQRKQDARYKTILDEMKKTEIVRALAKAGEKLLANYSGQTIASSEYWADMLDRWSEELVAASNCKSCSNCKGDSLPPEIVLKVMQALRDEMKLRDETRETENARPSLKEEKFLGDARELSAKQGKISDHTQGALDDILALPEGTAKFPKEIKLLEAVVDVMQETRNILNTPETGPKAIAAETEAIELLLQARRMGQNPGGGGGSNPGGGNGPKSVNSAALADLGPGADASASIAARNVGQATGRTGKEFPAELKAGLEAYFNLLETQPGR